MKPYNPLGRTHLADSIAREFFKRPLAPLPPESFPGAGIYAIYYGGDFPLYTPVACSLRAYESATAKKPTATITNQPIPLYIGKSDPPGSRKGLFTGASGKDAKAGGGEAVDEQTEELLTETPTHRKLFGRLTKHSKSISAANNLKLTDFKCRYMLVDEIWVPLGEARLVATFKPIWNVLIEGFGSNVEGGGRNDTARSVWDILHPGRKEGLGIQVAPEEEHSILNALRHAKDTEELALAIARHRDAKKKFAKARKKARSKQTSTKGNALDSDAP